MPRKLLLHIGCHKTGTSAIQRACAIHSDTLNRHGWHFATGPRNVANWGNAFGFGKEGEKVKFWIKQDFSPKIVESLSQTDGNVILSSEDLFFLEQEEITKLGALISPLFDEIELCAYLRRQDELAVSQKSQGAKTIQSALMFGFEGGALPDLTQSVRNYFDFAQKLGMWKSAFPKAQLSVKEYRRSALKDGDIVRDFSALIGMDLTTDNEDVNATMGANEVQLLLALRDHGLPQSEIQRIRDYEWIEFTQTPLQPTRAQAQGFLAQFEASNARLPEVVGHDFAFSDDFSKYPETPVDTGYGAYERKNLFGLVARLNGMTSLDRAISLRNIAMQIEKTNPKAALELAQMSHEMHPTGPMIRNLRDRLQKAVHAPQA